MKYFFLFCFLFLPILSFAHNRRVVTYAPSVFELTGTLDLQTFPGPPNYDSIKDGDDIERGFYLKLDRPIDVSVQGLHPDVDNEKSERNVKIMQLAINAEDDKLWAQFRNIGRGRHVKIKGTLFHRFTGHHHSRILLDVQSIQKFKRSQLSSSQNT